MFLSHAHRTVFYSSAITKELRELSFIVQQIQIMGTCGDKVLQDGEMGKVPFLRGKMDICS